MTDTTDIQALLDELHAKYKTETSGKVADYIPQLANVDPNQFAIAIVTVDGEIYSTGDDDFLFTLQSMSKPFTYAMALNDHGRDYMLTRVGVEPSGRSFNSVVLDESTGRPYNPMINAGAIAVADIIKGADLTEKLNRVVDTISDFAGRKIHLDGPTFTSEHQTGHRNRAIAHLMRAFGTIDGNIDDALHLYFQQCSLLVNTVDLATMASVFANTGDHPLTGKAIISHDIVVDILSVMYTCGMYDSSGEWAYKVGLPAKSGVSGGIWAVVPNRFGIAVFSAPLNEQSHSVRGVHVFEDLAKALKLHIFSEK